MIASSPIDWDRHYQSLVSEVWEQGDTISPTKGPCREILGHVFKHEHPRDRLILNTAHSFDVVPAIGHWLWTMAGRMEFESIRYYTPAADRFSVDKFRMHGAYGPRLFGIGVLNQIPRIIDMIRERKSTRRAVVTVHLPEFDSFRTKAGGAEDEVPCTIALQYLPRDGLLSACTMMRSQNVLGLLPLDLFIFTLLQEYVASGAGLEIGPYHHFSGSFHIYERDAQGIEAVQTWKTTDVRILLPKMDQVDQSKNLLEVLKMEEQIRNQAISAEKGRRRIDSRRHLNRIEELEPFWQAVIHILLAKASVVASDRELFRHVLDDCHGSIRPYLQKHYAQNFETTLNQFDFLRKEK